MAVLAIDIIGHLPVMSKGNRWPLTAICLHTSYVLFVITIKQTSAENVVQVHLYGILADKGLNVAILCTNGTELKTKSSMKHAINQKFKDYSPIHFIHKEI